MKNKLCTMIFVIAVCVIITIQVGAAPSFQGLGDLDGSRFASEAHAVSADGSVVVGWSESASGMEAFRWENGQMVGLGDLPGGIFYNYATDVSSDGSVVVGHGYSASGNEAFRWTSAGGMEGLGDLPGGGFYSHASGVSNDGSVVAGWGWSESASDYEAFRWKDLNGNGLVDDDEELGVNSEFGLGDLPGGSFNSRARSVSANGEVVVGDGQSALGMEAFRWKNGGMVGLGDLAGGLFGSMATDVSADGLVVVGEGQSASGREAFRWNDLNGNGLVDDDEKLGDHPEFGLGYLQSSDFYSHACSVSADGSIVVGYSTSSWAADDTWKAFIWDETHAMRNLHEVLVNDYRLDLTGWSLWMATGISGDGLTIVGEGINPSGSPEGWIATLEGPDVIPTPGAIVLGWIGVGFVGWLRRRRTL